MMSDLDTRAPPGGRTVSLINLNTYLQMTAGRVQVQAASTVCRSADSATT